MLRSWISFWTSNMLLLLGPQKIRFSWNSPPRSALSFLLQLPPRFWCYALYFSRNFQHVLLEQHTLDPTSHHAVDASLGTFSCNLHHALDAVPLTFPWTFQYALGGTHSTFSLNCQHALDATLSLSLLLVFPTRSCFFSFKDVEITLDTASCQGVDSALNQKV